MYQILPRAACSATLVARLYRFRWQIELCFKEWKSYANLHKFDTANPHIAAGLIWASLCAAMLKRFLAHAAQRVGSGTAISTRRVAMCAHLLLAAIVEAPLRGRGLLTALRRAMPYLLANARRSDVGRERTTGRLRAGLVLVGGASVITYESFLWSVPGNLEQEHERLRAQRINLPVSLFVRTAVPGSGKRRDNVPFSSVAAAARGLAARAPDSD